MRIRGLFEGDLPSPSQTEVVEAANCLHLREQIAEALAENERLRAKAPATRSPKTERATRSVSATTAKVVAPNLPQPPVKRLTAEEFIRRATRRLTDGERSQGLRDLPDNEKLELLVAFKGADFSRSLTVAQQFDLARRQANCELRAARKGQQTEAPRPEGRGFVAGVPNCRARLIGDLRGRASNCAVLMAQFEKTARDASLPLDERREAAKRLALEEERVRQIHAELKQLGA